MRAECFLDTNVSVYAAFPSRNDAAKQERTLKLFRESDFGLSAQVLQELYVTVTGKMRRPMAPELAVALMDEYRVFPTVPTDYPLVHGHAGAETPV